MGNAAAGKKRKIKSDGQVFEYRGDFAISDQWPQGTAKEKEIVSVLRIHPGVTQVEEGAFQKCINLREVTFNEGLEEIDAGAFHECSSLESITLPSTLTLTEIGACAFWACTSLREVVMDEEMPKIHSFSFVDCSSLERFSFPSLSKRLGVIIKTCHYPRVEEKIDAVRGVVERRESDLFIFAVTISAANMEVESDDWNTTKQSYDRVVKLITYYEIKEATTLFELALWKAGIDQKDISSPADRAECRIEVPGPVKDTILQYLN
jgi:hypothetical protein